MTDVLNSNINITTLVSSAPVDATTFNNLLIVTPTAIEMAEYEVKSYQTPADVDDDADLDTATADAVKLAMAQSLRPATIYVAYLDIADGTSLKVTVSGTVEISDTFTLDLNGATDTYTAVGPTPTPSIVATALAALLTAPGDGAITVDGAVITITGTITNYAASSSKAGALTAVPAISDLSNSMALILGACDAYIVTCDTTNEITHEAFSQYFETAGRYVYLAWVASEATLNNTPAGNFGARLNAADAERTLTFYSAMGSDEHVGCAVAAMIAGCDPDERATTLAYKPLAGVTADALTSTDRTNLEANNISFYGGIRGNYAFWEGKLANGRYFDEQQIVDWSEARIEEAIAQLFLDVSARGSKIPYSDAGIEQVAATVRRILKRGVNLGHFREVLNDQGALLSPKVVAPRFSTVAEADIAARLLRLTYTATFLGAVHKVSINGYISLTV